MTRDTLWYNNNASGQLTIQSPRLMTGRREIYIEIMYIYGLVLHVLKFMGYVLNF